MDYDELVAKLTIEVVGILNGKGASASYSDVYDWLWNKGVHHSDDAAKLADEYRGK
jgi:hypothetical protein